MLRIQIRCIRKILASWIRIRIRKKICGSTDPDPRVKISTKNCTKILNPNLNLKSSFLNCSINFKDKNKRKNLTKFDPDLFFLVRIRIRIKFKWMLSTGFYLLVARIRFSYFHLIVQVRGTSPTSPSPRARVSSSPSPKRETNVWPRSRQALILLYIFITEACANKNIKLIFLLLYEDLKIFLLK